MIARPLTETISPVTVEELRDWLNLRTVEPILSGLLLTATDFVIAHIRRELLPRDWLATITTEIEYPPRELRMSRTAFGSAWLELPYSELIEVKSVLVDGNPFTSFEFNNHINPGQVRFNNLSNFDIIQITYRAGMGIIPQVIKDSIKLIAGCIYENRGACDASTALHKSGAAELLKPFRLETL